MNVPDVAAPQALEVLAPTDSCAARSEALKHFANAAFEIESRALLTGDTRTAFLCGLLRLSATRLRDAEFRRVG